MEFQKAGDYYEFSVDVVNSGTIDGMVGTLNNIELTEEQKEYLEYSVTYTNGKELQEKDGLKAGQKERIIVKVKYRDDINTADLPNTDQELSLTFKVIYVQADDSAIIHYVCKRATTLHTEECTQTDSGTYCSGTGYTASGSKRTTTITYGNLGKKGTLNSGDAFDCDVNNDGIYDPATERFYYVSPAYEDGTYQEEYVTLIYYNNTTRGIPDNTRASIIAYDSSNENYHGPRTGYVNLPSVSQWSNPNLVANMKRQIRTEIGTTSTSGGTIESFNYIGKAARLLTTQELEKACNITVGSYKTGELDSCNYLMENTKYSSGSLGTRGFWLESSHSSSSILV